MRPTTRSHDPAREAAVDRPPLETLVIRRPEVALAALHPLRRRLLDLLRAPASASELARRLELSRQKVNYHVRRLEEAGLVETVSERRKGNVVERVVRAVASRFFLSPELVLSSELALRPEPERGGSGEGAGGGRYSSAELIASAARTIGEVAPLREEARSVGKRVAAMVLEREVRLHGAADQQAFAAALEEAVDRVIEEYRAPAEAEDADAFRIAVLGHPYAPERDP